MNVKNSSNQELRIGNIRDTQKRIQRLLSLIYILCILLVVTWFSSNFESTELSEKIAELDQALIIEELEYWDDYEVEGASVYLYGTYDDWLAQPDPIAEAFTNQFGWTSFSNLNVQRYYLDVWEDNHDNYTLADEDVAWIETDVLIPNEINHFIAYVDYYADAKKSQATRDRSRRIVKLEQYSKREYLDKMESIEAKIAERKELRARQIELLEEEEKNNEK